MRGDNMNWHKSESTERPIQVEVGKTSTFIRKNIEETEDGYSYDEIIVPNEEADVYKGTLYPTTDVQRSDIDYCLALLGADEEEATSEVNWSARIEKYREYYQSGKWSLERINTLLERGLITQEEYDYIVAQEDGK